MVMVMVMVMKVASTIFLSCVVVRGLIVGDRYGG